MHFETFETIYFYAIKHEKYNVLAMCFIYRILNVFKQKKQCFVMFRFIILETFYFF